MSRSIPDAFRGMTIVAWRDLTANALSLRGAFISILMLLVMVGAAFGLAGLAPSGPGIQNEYVLWAFAAYPTNDTADAGIVVWVSDAFGRPREQVDVALGEPILPNVPGEFVFRERETKFTNGTGWLGFEGLGPGFWPLEMRVGVLASTSVVYIDSTRPRADFTVWLRRFDLLGDGSARDVGLQAMRTDGRPAQGAGVWINNTLEGVTTADGFFGKRLTPGPWNVTVTYEGGVWTQHIRINPPTLFIPLTSGPDNILFFLAFLLMGLIGPIVAIALSYDAIAKERFQGSLEFLLVRPATRMGLAIGKFLGTFASVALPVVGVQLAALAGIAGLTGKWPEASFAIAFVLGTLGLLASYVLIMQIFSTFMKSPGTAILSAIAVWFVFNVLWDLVTLAAAAILRVEGGTPEYFSLAATTQLFNPSGVYQLALTAYLPSHLEGALGASLGGLPAWSGAAAFIAWIAALLVVAVILFQKRIV